MSALMHQDSEFYDERQTGVVLSRLTEDVGQCAAVYTSQISGFLRTIVSFVSGLAVCLSQSWKVTAIVACSLPLHTFVDWAGGEWATKLWLAQDEKRTRVSAKSEEILTSFRTVRAMDAEMREYSNYKSRLFELHGSTLDVGLASGIRSFIGGLIHWGTTSFILYYAGMQAIRGEIEPGAIVTLMAVISRWSNSFSSTFQRGTEFKKYNIASAKVLEILEREPSIRLDRGEPLNRRLSGKIEFRDVSFKYKSRDDYAVEHLSFVIEPGEAVAIVGESGCGKSTTLLLLERFYDVTEGQILVDGIDIRQISPIELRGQIASVPQTPVMFSMSVKDNIKFGRDSASRDDIVQAATVANAHKFVRQLKDGYQTKVQQNSLSGGQKQRICIARAVLLDAPILMMDEATASLDTESERLVQEALGTFKTGRTVILVAHRLATIRNADRIIVMDKGTAVEMGTHDSLLAQGGAYARLIEHQLL
jgi:ABC-type multidrug transport system fused ATPase/permease subunit